MDRHQFEEVVQRQFAMSRSVLSDKAREYADERDQLRNFKIAAALQGVTPRQALGGMLAKHMVSIYDLINEPECAPTHIWDAKLTDAINYLVLLRGMSVEELEAVARLQKREQDLTPPQKPQVRTPKDVHTNAS